MGKLNPESFKGKIYLLVVDKIIIGTIIAIAFVVYDQIKTISDNKEKQDAHKKQDEFNIKSQLNQQAFLTKTQLSQLNYDSLTHKNQLDFEIKSENNQVAFRQATIDGQRIQLEFERAKLSKEVWSIMTDTSKNIFTRAYTLRSALITKAVDEGTGIDIACRLFNEGLPSEDFVRIAKTCMPNGLTSLLQNADIISNELLSIRQPNGGFSQLKTLESLSDALNRIQSHQRAFREIISETIYDLGATNFKLLDNQAYLSEYLQPLFFVFEASSQPDAIKQSKNSILGLRVVGLINRVLLDNNDNEATEKLNQILDLKYDNQKNINFAKSIIKIMSLFRIHILTGNIAIPISKIAVNHCFKSSKSTIENLELKAEHYFLQFYASEFLLISMKSVGAIKGQLILIEFLDKFKIDLDNAKDKITLEKISNIYNSGKIVRQIVEVVGSFKTPESIKILTALSNIDENKLRFFPLCARHG